MVNKEKYLQRIGIDNPVIPSEENLNRLHERHVFAIPFENLDVYLKRKIELAPQHLYDKVVLRKRGGFCYELNSLFHDLLISLGYSSQIISSRIATSAGQFGPEYDHMSIVVNHTKTWLLDVGFGDLFIRPIEIGTEKIQTDGRHYFQIRKCSESDFLLQMSVDSVHFEDKYMFNLSGKSVHDFNDGCHYKQSDPESYFVKNTICTQPTSQGRITLFNNKLIKKNNGVREERNIDITQLEDILLQHFDITL